MVATPTSPGSSHRPAAGSSHGDLNALTAGKSGPRTRRGQERAEEEHHYVPVIVKRTDEARRHPDDILEHAVEEGERQHRRKPLSLLLSAITAGLILGFSAMAVAVVISGTANLDNPALTRVGMALVYPLGFVICILSGSQLFTEHTAVAVYPVLDRSVPFRSLLKVWSVVICGNLLGAAASAALLVLADPVIGARLGYDELGHHLLAFDALPLFMSALLAGWLMALGGWLILATPPTFSQMVSIYMVTFIIGLGGLHHSIAGAVELFAAIFLGVVMAIGDGVRFLVIALLGNLVGGSLFVSVLNYAHIRQTQVTESSADDTPPPVADDDEQPAA